MLRTGIFVLLVCGCASAAEPDSVDSALAHMYNQDYASAHEILNRVIASNPQDALPYAFRASAYLFYELDRLGVLESEFLLDDKQIAEKKQKLTPDPVNREKFIRAVQDAEARAGGALKLNPNDKDAIFAMCIAEGVTTDYMAFVEKKQLSSLSVAKRSSSYAQHLLQLDPKFYDAYLTAGITEYMLGSLPFFVKWFVHFDNVDGNKMKGVERLKLVSREGHYFRPFSKILLSIIALREKRPRDAQLYLTELARDYPQNKLFRKELGKVNAKMGFSAN
jgi:tetratricopeptide (TPR) repeat protein